MKITYIVNSRIPTEKAHGFAISKMCEQFGDLGHDVVLVVPTVSRPYPEDVFVYYGLRDSFKVKRIRTINFIEYVKLLGKFAFWLNELLFNCILIFKFFIRKEKNAAVYTRDEIVAFLFSWFYPTFWEANDKFPKKKRFFYKILLRKIRGIIVVNKIVKDLYIKELGVEDDDIFVARNAVDLREFEDIKSDRMSLRGELNLPSDKTIIGYVGKFKTVGEEKGVEFLVDCMSEIKKYSEKYLLCCVGGSMKDIEEIKKIISEQGLDDYIKLVSHVDRKLVVKYLKSFDILAMPFPDTYHYRYRMSPIKMFEYMAAGKPIIATDLPTIREVLGDNNSYIINSDEVPYFINAVKDIADDPAEADKRAARALEDVQQYTWQKRAENILNFIRR